MVELFSNINQEMEKTGHFRLKNKMLLQLVGKANSILEAVILKLKLFDRPEIAWKNANYAQIWEYLRDDFELTNRFGSLHFKLEFVEVSRLQTFMICLLQSTDEERKGMNGGKLNSVAKDLRERNHRVRQQRRRWLDALHRSALEDLRGRQRQSKHIIERVGGCLMTRLRLQWTNTG
ncbi:uncharacterized protein LOC122012808 isoform X2 [Zingiber officinale]|nr:uncharacterized protein LOC122012808 isoform X2 [Zingiber officinale]